jgi:peptidoglycan/LPS O-acetylase OafA/YrhL
MSALNVETISKIEALEAKPLAPPGGKNYKPELDVIRFLAIFTVYLHHTVDIRLFDTPKYGNAIHYLHNAMGFGLVSFFLLSGYLITTLLLREKERTGTVDVKAFLVRRMLRIWPLYFVGLLIGVIYSLWMHESDGMRYAAFLLMMGNWYCYFFGASMSPILPLWSISTQEQFYVFWPWAVKKFSRRGMVIISLILILTAAISLFYLGSVHQTNAAIWCNGFVSYGLFGVGILLAIAKYGKRNELSMWLRVVLIALCPICWFCGTYFFHIRESGDAESGIGVFSGYLLAALGSFALLFGLLDIPGKYIPGWLSYLGRISFGMYIFHVIIIMEIKRHVVFRYISSSDSFWSRNLASLIAFPLVILVSALSYRYFETWFLKLKPQRG